MAVKSEARPASYTRAAALVLSELSPRQEPILAPPSAVVQKPPMLENLSNEAKESQHLEK